MGIVEASSTWRVDNRVAGVEAFVPGILLVEVDKVLVESGSAMGKQLALAYFMVDEGILNLLFLSSMLQSEHGVPHRLVV